MIISEGNLVITRIKRKVQLGALNVVRGYDYNLFLVPKILHICFCSDVTAVMKYETIGALSAI